MRILLAIDGSKCSKEAIRKVITQVRSKGTQLRVLHVIEPITAYISAGMIPHYVPHIDQVEKDRKKEAQELLAQTVRQLREAGFRASEALERGNPKVKIINHAKQWRADLIVVGSHGWRGFSRFLMGSVSETVVRHAGCSVEVVRIPFIRRD
jgi:nucleotide-binding universal stress UspA family protein